MRLMNRRSMLQSTALIAGFGALGTSTRAAVPAGRDPFDYEVTRTDAEWRALLGDDYSVLREGKTEPQKTSPLWHEDRDGAYSCKGCDLLQYSSRTKVILAKGWLFFTASEPNAQLMSQDTRAEMVNDLGPFDIFIEVHCRRCASHMGHILLVDGKLLHCINGTSLNFEESSV